VTVSCLDTIWRTATRARDMCATVRTAPDGPVGVTYVPTHERPITWDICPEARHVQRLRPKAPQIAALTRRRSTEADAISPRGGRSSVGRSARGALHGSRLAGVPSWVTQGPVWGCGWQAAPQV
jgi:hypothetical protein